jgi:predicted N-acetyltransferase YhbS
MTHHRDFDLRPLHGTEAAAVAALIRHAFAHQGVPTDPPASALRETPEAIAAILATDGGFGAWAGAILLGCVVWQRKEPGALYLGRLSMHPEGRGRGIASALVAAVEEEARAQGLGRVTLSTRLVLADNRRLFAACGFREIRLQSHPGYAHPTFVDMEKRLA